MADRAYVWLPRVKPDLAESFRWYKKAAEAGNRDAMDIVGIDYRYGADVHKDYDKAREWYQKAAKRGSEEAVKALAGLPSKQ
jgi:TPR repeat protein